MKLSRVDLVNAVTVNGQNCQTLYTPSGAVNIRVESGLVLFDDQDGTKWVPMANVKLAYVEPKPAKGEK